jgi:hypothetical protein
MYHAKLAFKLRVVAPIRNDVGAGVGCNESWVSDEGCAEDGMKRLAAEASAGRVRHGNSTVAGHVAVVAVVVAVVVVVVAVAVVAVSRAGSAAAMDV